MSLLCLPLSLVNGSPVSYIVHVMAKGNNESVGGIQVKHTVSH